jgi:hypothetical protein
MTSWLSGVRNRRPSVARLLQNTSSMRSTHVAFLLAAGLLTGCVGPGLYPGPFGGYSPTFGSGYYGGGYSPVYRSASYYGDPYGHGNQGWYRDRYYGRSARELAADQARARRALRHDQQDRRDTLLEKQDRRRSSRQAEGTWKRKNVRYQQQQRRDQQERFRRERQEQRKRQDRAW